MVISKLARGGVAGVLLRWASGLRFPYLFLLTAVLFVFNLFIPDVVPLVDELIMGLVAMTLASIRKKPEENRDEELPTGDVKEHKADSDD